MTHRTPTRRGTSRTAGTRVLLARTGTALCLALTLGGCGSDSEPTATTDGRGEITFATGKDNTGQLQTLVDSWNSAHPDERVRMVELPEAADQVRQMLVQNAQIKSKSYDVVTLDAVWTAEFAARSWVVELPKDKFDPASFLAPALETGLYRDRLYAAPWLTGTGVLYYRTDLLAAAGIKEPPKTWAALADACAAVAKLPAGKGVACYAGQYDKYEGLTVNFSEAVQSAGGTVFDPAGKPQLTTPAVREGLSFLVDGFKQGRIPSKGITFKEEEGRREFQEGRLLFHRNWAYVYALASAADGSSKVNGRFDVAPLPGKDGLGSGTLGGNNLAVSAFSERQASARDFIAYVTSLETEREYAKKQSFPLSRAALYDDPEMLQRYPYLAVMKEAIGRAKPRPAAVRYGDVTAAIQDHVSAALTGQKSVDQATTDLQAALAALTG
ncbi:ABC transporter substrate-binding protein [Plantactinospora soyae]|uniref:Multiple sugar transport system substrate-binding protein n=1 Tax=Plantactinospora soyae TaxID=1544732 RepID=A0A927M1T2_9ACTN|nr:ABC transporter substrate-binding protein [Plantactinospora soyae]MBE1485255.1 multiple sugar transport system substrate-binding protein [Plantactinospora soyae]